MAAKIDLFETGFGMMRLVRFHPDGLSFGILTILKLSQYFALALITVCLLFNEALCSDKLEETVENGMACFAFLTQAILKTVIVVANKQNFKKMQKENTIWTVSEVLDGELREDIAKLQVRCYWIQIFSKWSFIGALSVFYLPVVFGQRKTTFGTAKCLPGIGDYWMGVFEVLLGLQCTFIIAGVDIVFIGGCVTLIIQLKIATYIITNINYDRNSVQPRTFVENYGKLLNFAGVMKVAYSGILLIQYTSGIVILCVVMHLFQFTYSSGSFEASYLLSLACLYSVMLWQQFFYCYISQRVSTQADVLSQSLHESNWYESLSEANMRFVLLTMMRTQKPLVFTAYDLFDINNGTFLKIMKLSYTYCALLGVLKDK